MMELMDDIRVGRAVRGVRIRKGLRQEDLGAIAGVSQDSVSRLERGLLGGMTVDRVRAIGAAVGVLIGLEPRWHGGELDRLLGARHSALHEAVAARLATLADWTIAPEVTFSEYGERGAIDILAWHAPTRTVLVIELKTEIVDVQELLGTLDRKRRLARKVARDRGWDAAVVATWVVLAEHRTNRRRVDAHRTVLRTALPADGRAMNAWLLAPRGPIAALSFWPRNDDVRSNRDLAPVRRVRGSNRAV
jgi:transcriptional regulator with XRE-family HTH domain